MFLLGWELKILDMLIPREIKRPRRGPDGQVSDLVAEHSSAQKGLYLDGESFDTPELAQVLWAMNRGDG